MIACEVGKRLCRPLRDGLELLVTYIPSVLKLAAPAAGFETEYTMSLCNFNRESFMQGKAFRRFEEVIEDE